MNIYQHSNYIKYLDSIFKDKSIKRTKTELAQFLNCQPGFISQVLSAGKTHFSMEHIYKVGEFLKLNSDEINYLILLLMYEKAGSNDLKKHFKKQIEDIQKDHKEITTRITKSDRKLSEDEKAVYYSHWGYMAIHISVSLPHLKSVKTIEEHFDLPHLFCHTVVEFLLDTGLLEKHENKLSIGKTRIHLERTSPFSKSLHQNWRQKAIESLVNDDEVNLNYSSVLALSLKDAHKIRELILDLIKKKEEILIPSPEEELIVFNVDYFKL